MREKSGFRRRLRPKLTGADEFGEDRSRLAGVKRQGEFAEQRLPRPAGGQVDADAAGGLADASTDFEQASTQSFDLRRAPRQRKLQQTKQIDQVVGKAMQEQTEGVGQKTMAAEPVGTEAVLELLDAVLALAAIVVKRKDLGSVAGAVSDEEAEVGSCGGVLGLVTDATLA